MALLSRAFPYEGESSTSTQRTGARCEVEGNVEYRKKGKWKKKGKQEGKCVWRKGFKCKCPVVPVAGYAGRKETDRPKSGGREEKIHCMLSLCCQEPADSEYKAHKKAVAGLRGKTYKP